MVDRCSRLRHGGSYQRLAGDPCAAGKLHGCGRWPCRSSTRTLTERPATSYGFALAFSFMIAGYQGQPPVSHQLLPFALLGLLGAACAALLALAGRALKPSHT